ncbi:MAG: helix-turn-helix transcriptional regulator [Gemmatimonadota bacterium]
MRQAPHAHHELHLSIVLRGTVSESIARRSEILGPLSVVSKDAGVRHADAWGDGGAVLARLSLPGGGLCDLADDSRTVPTWRWSHDPRVAGPFLRLVLRARGANTPMEHDDADVTDLVAAITTRPGDDLRAGTSPAWLHEAVEFMLGSWHPTLGVGDVARHVGVHPVYLARCLRHWYGTTAGDELRRMRLRTAVRSLVGTTVTVSHVAHAMGFADEPHLCRSVRAATSFTPGQLRRVVRHAEAIACPGGGR